MSPAPAPAGAAKPGGKIFGMPPWAIAVAVGGGLLVGFVLLKKSPSSSDSEQPSDAQQAAQSGGSGGGGGSPASDSALLTALGLTPSTQMPAVVTSDQSFVTGQDVYGSAAAADYGPGTGLPVLGVQDSWQWQSPLLNGANSPAGVNVTSSPYVQGGGGISAETSHQEALAQAANDAASGSHTSGL